VSGVCERDCGAKLTTARCVVLARLRDDYKHLVEFHGNAISERRGNSSVWALRNSRIPTRGRRRASTVGLRAARKIE
jgi:hypothetical protein